MIILAVQPEEMLSFTWNAPPVSPSVRGQMTHVTITLEEIDPNQTLLSLKHDGWGQGGEWDLAFEYFTRAWGEVVLPEAHHRFLTGPVDWENPRFLINKIGRPGWLPELNKKYLSCLILIYQIFPSNTTLNLIHSPCLI